MKTRRYIVVAIATCLLTWLLALAGCNSQNGTQSQVSQVSPTSAASQLKVINIGHQSGTPGLNLLKAQRLLEKRLAPEGIHVH
jgi:sulfonate transport system substrate-binding protein